RRGHARLLTVDLDRQRLHRRHHDAPSAADRRLRVRHVRAAIQLVQVAGQVELRDVAHASTSSSPSEGSAIGRIFIPPAKYRQLPTITLLHTCSIRSSSISTVKRELR